MTPQLSPEQKEQLKMARRSNLRIDETWSLYTMFLSSQEKMAPQDALERALEAVAVWADWMDHNEIEPPEIEHPDFATQLTQQMGKVFEGIARSGPSLRAALASEVATLPAKLSTEPVCTHPVGLTTCGYTESEHHRKDRSPMDHDFTTTPPKGDPD